MLVFIIILTHTLYAKNITLTAPKNGTTWRVTQSSFKGTKTEYFPLQNIDLTIEYSTRYDGTTYCEYNLVAYFPDRPPIVIDTLISLTPVPTPFEKEANLIETCLPLKIPRPTQHLP